MTMRVQEARMFVFTANPTAINIMGMSVRTARRRGAPLHMSHTSAEIFC